jgi:hypothetical protein
VTGASRGIGKSIAELFAAEGAAVAIVVRAITRTAADSAAVLQGAARGMIPAPPAARTTTSPTSDASQTRAPSPASFVAELLARRPAYCATRSGSNASTHSAPKAKP